VGKKLGAANDGPASEAASCGRYGEFVTSKLPFENTLEAIAL
jgi:hypothetical protein